jgi:cytidylate kinase
MEARWCGEEVAKELIAKSDRNKALYFRHVMRVDWNDPMLYDMVLRTDLLGIEQTVEILASRFEKQPEVK